MAWCTNYMFDKDGNMRSEEEQLEALNEDINRMKPIFFWAPIIFVSCWIILLLFFILFFAL